MAGEAVTAPSPTGDTVVIGPWANKQQKNDRAALEARIEQLEDHQERRYDAVEGLCELITRRQNEIENLKGQL